MSRRRALLRWGIFAAGVLLVALGILNGGARDVWTKAIAVCMECIGLG